MKKIDWYILKKFLSTFFFAILLFTIIAVVVDVSEKTDEMVRSRLGVKRIILEYYIGFVPHIIALLFPLFVFISVIYFTSKMAVKSEIIAIIAGGTSYWRWLRPYWVGSIILAMVLWFANQYVVPRANKIRSSFESKYILMPTLATMRWWGGIRIFIFVSILLPMQVLCAMIRW